MLKRTRSIKYMRVCGDNNNNYARVKKQKDNVELVYGRRCKQKKLMLVSKIVFLFYQPFSMFFVFRYS